MKKLNLLFLVLAVISCKDNNENDDIQICPIQEIINNEPNIIEYSQIIENPVKSYKFTFGILSNKIQKQIYFEKSNNTTNFVRINEDLYVYNVCNFLEKIERYSVNNNYEFIENWRKYEYDKKGRLINLYENGNLINQSGGNSPTFEYNDNTVSFKKKYQTNGIKLITLTFSNESLLTDYIEYADYFGNGPTKVTKYKYIYDSEKKLIEIQLLDNNNEWINDDTYKYSKLINPIGILRNRMFGRQNNTLLNCFYFGPKFGTNNPLTEFLYMPENSEITESYNDVATKFYNYEFTIE
jgi:hypothetical protein